MATSIRARGQTEEIRQYLRSTSIVTLPRQTKSSMTLIMLFALKWRMHFRRFTALKWRKSEQERAPGSLRVSAP